MRRLLGEGAVRFETRIQLAGQWPRLERIVERERLIVHHLVARCGTSEFHFAVAIERCDRARNLRSDHRPVAHHVCRTGLHASDEECKHA